MNTAGRSDSLCKAWDRGNRGVRKGVNRGSSPSALLPFCSECAFVVGAALCIVGVFAAAPTPPARWPAAASPCPPCDDGKCLQTFQNVLGATSAFGNHGSKRSLVIGGTRDGRHIEVEAGAAGTGQAIVPGGDVGVDSKARGKPRKGMHWGVV